MRYSLSREGESRSFPDGDPFLARGVEEGDALVCLGDLRRRDLSGVLSAAADRAIVLLELGTECLGVYLDDTAADNVLGFARYRTGMSARPSGLVELVRLPGSSETAISAATDLFNGAGLEVAVCSDQAGRIIDRLVRPKYNCALRMVDEGLATAEAIDLTCKLGLGYSDGPVERVIAGGLADHHRICRALFEIYGSSAYAPARTAVVAAMRVERGK